MVGVHLEYFQTSALLVHSKFKSSDIFTLSLPSHKQVERVEKITFGFLIHNSVHVIVCLQLLYISNLLYVSAKSKHSNDALSGWIYIKILSLLGKYENTK